MIKWREEEVRVMGLAMFEHTKTDIKEAYADNNLPKIGKETLYVFDRVVHFMLSSFKDRLKGITFETNDIHFDERYLRSQKNKDYMLNMFQFIHEVSLPVSDVDFGKLKVDVERWYYQMGGSGMYFDYHETYLMTPKDAAEILEVSNVTLNKYVKQGLEAIETTSHHKIPKHAVELWKDPVYAIKMQVLVQEKKLRNQSIEERLQEVRNEIMDWQKKYQAKTVQEAMDHRNIDYMDEMDDPSDFRSWQDLEGEEMNILEELIGGKGFV